MTEGGDKLLFIRMICSANLHLCGGEPSQAPKLRNENRVITQGLLVARRKCHLKVTFAKVAQRWEIPAPPLLGCAFGIAGGFAPPAPPFIENLLCIKGFHGWLGDARGTRSVPLQT